MTISKTWETRLLVDSEFFLFIDQILTKTSPGEYVEFTLRKISLRRDYTFTVTLVCQERGVVSLRVETCFPRKTLYTDRPERIHTRVQAPPVPT